MITGQGLFLFQLGTEGWREWVIAPDPDSALAQSECHDKGAPIELISDSRAKELDIIDINEQLDLDFLHEDELDEDTYTLEGYKIIESMYDALKRARESEAAIPEIIATEIF